MAKYKSIVVTNGGLDLVAAAHNGDTIEFTTIKTGAGVYDGTEVIAEATALKEVKQTLGISGLVKDDNVIKVNTTLSNDGLDAGYSVTELGLYAKDSSGNEILYAIVVAEPGMEDYIPTYADAPTTVTFELYVDATAYESGVTFQATVIAGTYATPQDVNDAVASMTSRMGTMQTTIMQEVNAELDKKVNTVDIVDNLISTATDLPLSANQGKKLMEMVDEHLIYTWSYHASSTLKPIYIRDYATKGSRFFNGIITATGIGSNRNDAVLLGVGKSGTYWGNGYVIPLISNCITVTRDSDYYVKITPSTDCMINLLLDKKFEYCISDSPTSGPWITVS